MAEAIEALELISFLADLEKKVCMEELKCEKHG